MCSPPSINEDEQRLRRILRDLLGHAGERLYLCHSELAVNGQEQTGPLLSLVNASMPLVSEPTPTLPRQEAQPMTPS